MNTHLTTLAIAAVVLTASAGCMHRTATYRTTDTVRTDTSPVPAPQPVVEDTTTVIKHSSSSSTEGGQK
jgi:hypothetical protein